MQEQQRDTEQQCISDLKYSNNVYSKKTPSTRSNTKC